MHAAVLFVHSLVALLPYAMLASRIPGCLTTPLNSVAARAIRIVTFAGVAFGRSGLLPAVRAAWLDHLMLCAAVAFWRGSTDEQRHGDNTTAFLRGMRLRGALLCP